jgi:hypothetical protein
VEEKSVMDNLRNRSLGELLTDLSRDTSVLVRKELELARLEMSRIAGTLARRATFIAIGAVLAVAGLLSLIATLTLAGIALGLSPLAASAIVTLLTIVIGGVLVMRGVAAWPVVVLLGGLVVNNLSLNAALHPVYFTDDVIPYHGLWHSAIIGMRYDATEFGQAATEVLVYGTAVKLSRS